MKVVLTDLIFLLITVSSRLKYVLIHPVTNYLHSLNISMKEFKYNKIILLLIYYTAKHIYFFHNKNMEFLMQKDNLSSCHTLN